VIIYRTFVKDPWVKFNQTQSANLFKCIDSNYSVSFIAFRLKEKIRSINISRVLEKHTNVFILEILGKNEQKIHKFSLSFSIKNQIKLPIENNFKSFKKQFRVKRCI
jgi:hypothetical protein